MKIDIERYSVNKKYIQDMYLSKYKDDPSRAVGQLAAATMVPCIVIAYYIGPLCNWHPDLIKTIKALVDFYGYTEIENKPEGSPL